MDISCATLPIVMESIGQQQFHHFSHGHPLKLIEMKLDDEFLCSACQKNCSGQTYVCCNSKCGFFLHDVCFNLPQHIHHPFHPYHSLAFLSPIQRQSRPECRACYRSCSGFTYSCNHCGFDVDVECPVTISSIKYHGHPHEILFVDGLDPCRIDADDDVIDTSTVLLCCACGTGCKALTAMFHCVQCDFHLHFKCGPLSCFIKHENHMCLLKLADSPLLVEGEDKDTNVVCCDTCEKERDPRLPVYYCSDGCAYIVEIKCMISEVLLSLTGDYGEIELRSAVLFKLKTGNVICKGIEVVWKDCIADGDTEANKVEVSPSLTMKEILDALSELEKCEIEMAFSCSLNDDRYLIDKGPFSRSDEDYAKFMALVDSPHAENTTNLVDLLGNDKKVVNVGKHSVISNLAPILEDLCTEYGDTIFLESTLQSSGVKTFFINVLCETIRSMCTSRIVDISEPKLFNWWRCLRTLQSLGFRVEFALDRLKRAVHAYYALRVQETERRDLEEMDREIEEVSRDIDQLRAKVVAQEAKLVALKEGRMRREPSKVANSSKVAECFKEASVLKWMIAGEGVL